MAHLRVTYKGFKYHEAGAIEQAAPILRRTHASLTRQISTDAKHKVPVLTGFLGRSIAVDPQRWIGPLHVGGGVTAWAKYAKFVHDGTGIYGPTGRPITAKKPGGVLHFFWNGREVFMRSVKGQRARPFLRNAGRDVTARDPRVHLR